MLFEDLSSPNIFMIMNLVKQHSRQCRFQVTMTTWTVERFTMEQRLYTEEGISWSHIEWLLGIGSTGFQVPRVGRVR